MKHNSLLAVLAILVLGTLSCGLNTDFGSQQQPQVGLVWARGRKWVYLTRG